MRFNRSILETNLSLKISSLLLGTVFWIIFSATHTGTMTVDVPFSFYGTNEKQEIKAPEKIRLELSGKHTDLAALDIENIAVHINSEELSEGDNFIELSAENLFLPSSVKLIHCAPSNPIVTLLDSSKTTHLQKDTITT